MTNFEAPPGKNATENTQNIEVILYIEKIVLDDCSFRAYC